MYDPGIRCHIQIKDIQIKVLRRAKSYTGMRKLSNDISASDGRPVPCGTRETMSNSSGIVELTR